MASEIIVNTIKAPTTGANANKIIVPTGQKIVGTDSGSVQYPNSILQVQDSGTFGDHINSAGNTWASTNCSVTITPSSSSNKILVDLTGAILLVGTGTIMRGSFKVIRTISGTSTTVWNTSEFIEQFQVRNATSEHTTVFHAHFIDAPSTTSPITYTVQSLRYTDSGMSQIRLWGNTRGSAMYCREIAQ